MAQARLERRRSLRRKQILDVLIAFAVARRWPDVLSNALEPGWVATRMGGANAPDDLDQAHRTQVWLAVSDDPEARVTGSISATNASARPTRRRPPPNCRTG